MLDEFDDGKPANGGGVQGDVLDENWARMLQEGMADLLNDVNESVCCLLTNTRSTHELMVRITSQRCRVNLKSWLKSWMMLWPLLVQTKPWIQDRQALQQ
jgi:hypothetical protein